MNSDNKIRNEALRELTSKRILPIIVFAVLACVIVIVFCGCGSGRDYYEDINIQLEERNAELIIREWAFLLGSGAEIYYKTDDEEVLLGQIQGGDDGFCPFQEGLYSVSADDKQVTIEWCIFPSDKDKPWEKKTFELPSN